MVRRKRNTMRKKQKGGFWSPFSSDTEDPNASKSGFFENIGSYFSSATDKANAGLGTAASSITDSASSLSSSLSSSVSSSVSSLNPFASSASSTSPSTSASSTSEPPSSYGGRRRMKTKRTAMKGGKGGLGLTYYATDVSNTGLKVAEPTYWIKGGSRRKNCRTRRKSRKHKKH
jgi:hypothetical protein